MLKALFLSAALVAAPVAAIAAAPPVSEVSVVIGPELQKKAKDIGQRELDELRGELHRAVTRELEREGASSPQGGKLELVIADAQPNRPTFTQMGRTPGLSYSSFGIGGAQIEGAYVAPDGARTPVYYRWFENDIRNAWWQGTWGDAERAFDRFAHDFAAGKPLVKK